MSYSPDHRDASECRRLRESHGLSLAQMSELARLSDRTCWARYERASSAIDPARWELCLLLLGEHPTLTLAGPNTGPTSSQKSALVVLP